MNTQKVAVLIDNQNIYYSAKRLYGGLINYQALIDYLVQEREVIYKAAFVVRANIGEQYFFEALKRIGVKVLEMPLKIHKDGRKKGNWDMGMAVAALVLIDSRPDLETIILVSGDGDFAPFVRYLKNYKKKKVEVAAFGQHTSWRLRNVADKYYDLEEAPQVIFKPAESAPLALNN